MTGNEHLRKYKCNPDHIEFEGTIYTESDLATMDSSDYEEIMESGIVVYIGGLNHPLYQIKNTKECVHMKKYELSNEKVEHYEFTVYRVRALRDFGDVKKGDLGGFIEDEFNLSQEGDCWLYGDSTCAKDYAVVSGNAKIYDGTTLTGDVEISGDVSIYSSSISDNISISGKGVIRDCYIELTPNT